MMADLESFSENYKLHSIAVLSFLNEVGIIWVLRSTGDLAVLYFDIYHKTLDII